MEDDWDWEVGDEWGCEVHSAGRTGGVHDATPMFGLLTVPADLDAAMSWEEVEF